MRLEDYAPALPSSDGNRKPTKREEQVILLLAQDLTAKEIAARLGICTKTAEFHVQSIRKRLGVQGQRRHHTLGYSGTFDRALTLLRPASISRTISLPHQSSSRW
jgi:hypothetical protein